VSQTKPFSVKAYGQKNPTGHAAAGRTRSGLDWGKAGLTACVQVCRTMTDQVGALRGSASTARRSDRWRSGKTSYAASRSSIRFVQRPRQARANQESKSAGCSTATYASSSVSDRRSVQIKTRHLARCHFGECSRRDILPVRSRGLRSSTPAGEGFSSRNPSPPATVALSPPALNAHVAFAGITPCGMCGCLSRRFAGSGRACRQRR
jgi:hypothetical protein